MANTFKLKSMPYAQCSVIFTSECIQLQSYNTIVLELTYDDWLSVYGLYSMTTRKHISAFMREYTNFDYYTAKSAFENNYDINLETGEILEK